MLSLKGVSSGYGRNEVLKDVNIAIQENEVVTIIGLNGAGKSTLIQTISGLLKCNKGQIIFENEDITTSPSCIRVKKGIVEVPEGRQVFAPLTVYENLKLGMYSKYRNMPKEEQKKQFRFIYELFPILFERRNQKAGTLSGGEQQMLAIGRALMSKPKLLLLDEPSLGLAPKIVALIFEVLRQLSKTGLPVILVEQNANYAFDAASRGYVMDMGRIVLEGPTSVLVKNEKVKDIYLGEMAV